MKPKNMKLKMHLTLALLGAMLSAPLAQAAEVAGPSSSGGGSAVVCRNPDGKIYYSELLDLFEARAVIGLKLPAASGSIYTDYRRSVENTHRLQGHPDLADKIVEQSDENLRRFFDIVRMTQPGERLPRLDDVGEHPRLSPNCGLEQLAIFHDTEPAVVEIDTEIWETLDSLNRAALVTHELFYQWDRINKEPTSEGTRSLVAHVYAEKGAVPNSHGVPEGATSCYAHNPKAANPGSSITLFHAFSVNTPEGTGTRLQFYSYSARAAIVKTVADLPGILPRMTKSWNMIDGQPMPLLIVDEPNVDRTLMAPFRSGYRKGWTVEVALKTGQPVRLTFKRKGVVMTEEFFSSCD